LNSKVKSGFCQVICALGYGYLTSVNNGICLLSEPRFAKSRNQRYECHLDIHRVDPTECKMSDFAVLTPTYEDLQLTVMDFADTSLSTYGNILRKLLRWKQSWHS